jgi:hypothetical protein
MEWQAFEHFDDSKLKTATSVSRVKMRGWADFLKSTKEKDGWRQLPERSKHISPDPDREGTS